MPIIPLKPQPLQNGDLVGVISPASPMPPENLTKGIHYLQSLGYSVLKGDHVMDSYGFLAGNDNDRLNDLHAMFSNPDVKAIFSSRGGYGTPRLLYELDFELIRKNPKIIMGYSDLTAIQLAIWSQTGLITFSGPMVAVEMKEVDPFTERNMWSVLTSTDLDGVFPIDPNNPLEIIVPGKASGRLLGGCLSVLVSLLGTPFQPDFNEAILILEEVGEEPFRVDRYFSHLKLAGILDQVNGVILGKFIDCLPEEGKPNFTITEVINDYFGNLDIPVVSGFLYGHLPRKLTLPIGAKVEMDTSLSRVRLLEPGIDPN